ncbi:cobalamin biosynthesis protein [Vulcaniibacterium gelatinicum]|uniref:cobalamin biosynthesis protein n=1 Tax=Vulcaniibacterium gelatinicum TaxID=2598725 RepID=UPI0011CAD398|nr:cobalamin biosynthesis protein [Vulcaniibacterium gelatinicum]
MSVTLIAVVVALVIGHTMPQLAELRRFGWFVRWLEWLDGQFAANDLWHGRWGLAFAVVPPLLLVLLLQLALRDDLYGLPEFLFSVLVLFYAWGPRDLDRDVEAVAEAQDAAARRAAAARLFPDRDMPVLDGGALVEAVFHCALWRWFSVLFWFLLLGPVGALLYRLLALAAQGEAGRRLPPAAMQAARTLRGWMDWPVAQLMTLAMALVGNFDAVLGAWKEAGGASFAGGTGFLAAAARASVRVELAEEAADYGEGGLEPGGAGAALPELPELRDAMSLVWRILLLWLVVLALFVIAGWVG